jgi:hypothetical protein
MANIYIVAISRLAGVSRAVSLKPITCDRCASAAGVKRGGRSGLGLPGPPYAASVAPYQVVGNHFTQATPSWGVASASHMPDLSDGGGLSVDPAVMVMGPTQQQRQWAAQQQHMAAAMAMGAQVCPT